MEADPTLAYRLKELGVEYIYIGARGNYASRGLDAEALAEVEGLNVLYQQEGVSILHIGP